ncbi:hypothetical protein T4D_11507 [Trichinella pseudospiralis]|uniref:Uncharacterized protein n=1 Tax=Trichinella pseudospiralis TaxID=6337 RepID=A0A0V1FDK2_TRIPS|nr:hypothetical protein T4D_11507 [Trichinella pseudospiralis]
MRSSKEINVNNFVSSIYHFINLNIPLSNNTNIAHKENIIIDSSSVDICLSSGTAVIINK